MMQQFIPVTEQTKERDALLYCPNCGKVSEKRTTSDDGVMVLQCEGCGFKDEAEPMNFPPEATNPGSTLRGESVTLEDIVEAAESMDPANRVFPQFNKGGRVRLFVAGQEIKGVTTLELGNMGRPTVRNEEHRLVQCPRCGLVAQVDEDQWKGRVSIDCPDCDYHETHDLANQNKDQ